jgi:hypothetical protein
MISGTPQLTTALFVGTWQLESFTETMRGGRTVEPMGKKPRGFLLYTHDGIVSAQLSGAGSASSHDPSEEPGPVDKPTASYIGYCGKFTVSPEVQQVVHIPMVAHDARLIGLSLYRHVKIDSDRLTLTTLADASGTDVIEARLVWRRYRQ